MTKLRIAFVALALAVMALPCALTPLMPATIGAENRLPAKMPALVTEEGLNLSFPEGFEAWLQDHVGLRGAWISLYSRALGALGASSKEAVILGREGWLFFRDTLNDYTGAADLPDGDIARLALLIDTADAGLRQRGSRLILAVVPNKASVYPEYMNAAYPRRSAPSNAQRLGEAVNALQVPLYDLLAAHRDEGLYFATDTHWNALGARYAARAILEAVGEACGTEILLPDADVSYETRRDWPGDLARMLDPYTEAREDQQYFDDAGGFSYAGRYRSPEDLTIRTQGGAADLNLLVLRDSFTNQLVEPISRAVGEAAYLRAMPLPLMDAEGYDAVVLEIVERRLPELLEAPPQMPAPEAEAPGDLPGAATSALTLNVERGEGYARVYGALSEMPDGLSALLLGVRAAGEEHWYGAFPVSGDAGDGGRGFSALLAELPEGAQVCVFARGEGTVKSAWKAI